jgi:hypothetical protein
MLPVWFIIFAVAIRFIGGLTYAWAVIKKRARPNPVTWFFWSLTPMIVFAAQISEHIGWSAAMTFALGFSPLIVFVLSLKDNLNRSQLTPATITCGVLAAIGVMLWLTTNNPALAILFSILADIFGSIPTVIKAYKNPKSEVAFPYFLSSASMVITLLTITKWSLPSYGFPIYIFLINALIFSLVYFGSPTPKSARSKKRALQGKPA